MANRNHVSVCDITTFLFISLNTSSITSMAPGFLDLAHGVLHGKYRRYYGVAIAMSTL